MSKGWVIGMIELTLYFLTSSQIRKRYRPFKKMDTITYYWLSMTILTLIWECAFVLDYKNVNIISQQLIKNKEHVWNNEYDLSYVLPWKLSTIFYAEYGAYADREYMINRNDWSRVIESTHALFCGLFAYFTLYSKTTKRENKNYLISLGVSMGSQLMNSILYMSNYFNQLEDIHNVNYCKSDFPCGFVLLYRPFMYVNILWTLMPLYTIIKALQHRGSLRTFDIFVLF